MKEKVIIMLPMQRFFDDRTRFKITEEHPNQGQNIIEIHENYSIMTHKKDIPSVANTMKKFISVQVFLMNTLQHIRMMIMMVLNYCSESIQIFILKTKTTYT